MIWSTPASEHEVLIFGLARQECWPHESLEVRCWSSPDLYLHHSEEKLYLKSCVTTRNAAKWMFPSRHCPEKLQEGIRNPVNVIERWGGRDKKHNGCKQDGHSILKTPNNMTTNLQQQVLSIKQSINQSIISIIIIIVIVILHWHWYHYS